MSAMDTSAGVEAGKNTLIKKLGDVLKERDLIDEEEILSAIHMAKQSGKKLGQVLLERGDLTEDDLLMALGDQLGFNIVSLGNYPIDQKVAALISRETCEERMCVPLRLDENDVLHVAMKDVSNGELLQYLKFSTGKQIAPCIALESEIIGTISRIYDFAASLEDLVSSVGKLTDMEFIDPERDADAAEARSFTITQIVKSVLGEAVAKGASDIHMEPSQTFLRVRVRIDGQLQSLINIPKWVQSQVIGCIKVQACLNIAEKRLPQDGKLSANIANRHIDFRVSTLPTPLGEKVVIRIQDKGKKGYTLSSLKLPPYLMKQVLRLLQSDKGIILVTGPTGSGKTTLLYSMLTELVRKGPNIITVEDPIEFEFDGITQTQINEKAGMTFPTILRSILRQDPNVIMIGEIRDQQTAEIAFRAAQTGHLVLSTLHTNSAVSVVTRLKDLGIEPFLIASTVRGIFAQRLVRCNCPECVGLEDRANIADAAQKKLLHLLPAGTALKRGQGCEKCSNSGYLGRIGVYEYLKFTPAVVDAVNASLPEKQILQVAKADGAKTLADECVRLITEGITSFSECASILTTQDVEEASGSSPGTTVQQSCPACGKGISAEFVVCPYCQHPLECQCPKCSSRVEPGWQACPYCATRLGAPLAEVAAMQKPAVAPAAVTMPPPASKSPEPVANEAVSVKRQIETVEMPAPREISRPAAVPTKEHAAPARPRAEKIPPVEVAAAVPTQIASGGAAAAPSRRIVPVVLPGRIVPKVIAGDAQAVLSFATPADNGAPLVSYRIEITHAGSDAVVLTVDATNGAKAASGRLAATVLVNGGNTGIRIGGLYNGRVYGLTVAASNRVATGQPSAKVIVKPLTVPSVPAIQSVEAGNSEARVVFSAPASSGGSAVTGYIVVSSPAGGVDADAGSMSLTHTITGLSNGTAYTFAVAAINAVGVGSSSAASTPVVPQAPQVVTLGSATLAESLATDTIVLAAPIVPTVMAKNVTTETLQVAPCESVKLTDPLATNMIIPAAAVVPAGRRHRDISVSPAAVAESHSGDVVSTDAGKPTSAEIKQEIAPTLGASAIVSVQAGDAQAKVRFSPPATSGGSAITGYTVISNPPGGIDIHAGITGLTHTITGLTNGTDYTFTVIATNAAGNSVSSAPSIGVTPATVPAQPNVNAMPGDGHIALGFTTPADNGAALTAYTVEVSSPGRGTSHVTLNAADNSTASIESLVATLSISGKDSRITITGLVNGKTYCLNVAASNRIGLGAVSANVIAKPFPGN